MSATVTIGRDQLRQCLARWKTDREALQRAHRDIDELLHTTDRQAAELDMLRRRLAETRSPRFAQVVAERDEWERRYRRLETRLRRTHCGICGERVCTCGFDDYESPAAAQREGAAAGHGR